MPDRFRIPTVAFTLFCATFANNALSPIYVIYQQKFHFSSLVVTSIFATYAVAVLAALLSFGRLSDQVGRKALLFAGSVLLIASTIVFLSAPDTAALFIARAILGLATGTLTGAGAAALVDLDVKHDRRRASLITTVAFLGGAATGPLAFGCIAEFLPHPTTSPFIVELAMQVIAAGAIAGMAEPATHELRRGPWRPQRPAVPADIRRPFFVAGAVVTTGWMVGGLFGSLSGSMDRQLLHVDSHAVAGTVLFAFAFVGGVSQLLFRVTPTRTTMNVGIGATAVGLALVECALFASSAPLFLFATVTIGVGNGLSFLGSLALVNEVAPRLQRAEIVSAYNVVAYFALSLPIIGVGLLTNVVGLKAATLIFALAVGALAVASFGLVAWDAGARASTTRAIEVPTS